MTMTALVVDDHPMCRSATAMALRIVDPAFAVVEAASIAEARSLATDAAVMTLDLGLPDSGGMAGLAELRKDFPVLPILVISGASNPAVGREVARLGAQGYVPKAAPISTMIEALRTIVAKETWFSRESADTDVSDDFSLLASLTPAQHRVLAAMEGGRLNKQIAFDLSLSEITVKAHVKAILKKLGAVNRTQAILTARRAIA